MTRIRRWPRRSIPAATLAQNALAVGAVGTGVGVGAGVGSGVGAGVGEAVAALGVPAAPALGDAGAPVTGDSVGPRDAPALEGPLDGVDEHDAMRRRTASVTATRRTERW